MIISITAYSFIYRLISSVECQYRITDSMCNTYIGKFCLCHEGGLKYLHTHNIRVFVYVTEQTDSDQTFIIWYVVRRVKWYVTDNLYFSLISIRLIFISADVFQSPVNATAFSDVQNLHQRMQNGSEIIHTPPGIFLAIQALIVQTCTFPL